MKKFLIAGNWKMNKTAKEARGFVEELLNAGLKNTEQAALMVPFTDIAIVKEALKGTGIRVGAQNVHFETNGAFTGEISISMLKELNTDMCIVGHSERREYFAESDNTVNKKLKTLLDGGIDPILCVGETLDIREKGNEKTFVCEQIELAFEGISKEKAGGVIIAYEPIWAIGTGKTAAPEQAEEMCSFIRSVMAELYGNEIAKELIIQYGGSMKPANARELLAKPNINGGLIGGASLKAGDFADIIKIASEISE